MGRDAYKRSLDLVVLTLAHLALLPLWLLLWTLMPALTRLGNRGAIFYKQERADKGGRAFTIRKFCTMAPNADRRGPLWTRAADLCVTLLDRLLRRTSCLKSSASGRGA